MFRWFWLSSAWDVLILLWGAFDAGDAPGIAEKAGGDSDPDG